MAERHTISCQSSAIYENTKPPAACRFSAKLFVSVITNNPVCLLASTVALDKFTFPTATPANCHLLQQLPPNGFHQPLLASSTSTNLLSTSLNGHPTLSTNYTNNDTRRPLLHRHTSAMSCAHNAPRYHQCLCCSRTFTNGGSLNKHISQDATCLKQCMPQLLRLHQTQHRFKNPNDATQRTNEDNNMTTNGHTCFISTLMMAHKFKTHPTTTSLNHPFHPTMMRPLPHLNPWKLKSTTLEIPLCPIRHSYHRTHKKC